MGNKTNDRNRAAMERLRFNRACRGEREKAKAGIRVMNTESSVHLV
jgi:hypothetical protein